MNTSRESSPDTGQEADKATEDKKVVENVADKVGEALNAQRFQMLEDIARELAGEVVFPTSFEAAIRLRKALLNSNLPIPRIASIVSVEPLVAAKLIHLANSVLYSPDGTPARDLQAAISRLGVNLVRTTALAIAMSQLMRSKEMAIFTDFTQALWAHTLKTAAAARILARTQTRINPDEALLAGIVHDIGIFYLLYRAAEYPEYRDNEQSVLDLVIGWHESIGESLLHVLGLPERIVDAVRDHDQLRTSRDDAMNLSDVIYFANLLAGGNFEWLHKFDGPRNVEASADDRKRFADILEEAEDDIRELRTALAA